MMRGSSKAWRPTRMAVSTRYIDAPSSTILVTTVKMEQAQVLGG
jgi:hypothetical protein